jgi:multidrug efflux pump subunit AcrB
MKALDIILIIMGIALAIFIPFAVIWALNTLFSFAIAYTFSTWLATYILLLALPQQSIKRFK